MKNILARGGIEFLAVFLGIALSLWVDDYRDKINTKIEINPKTKILIDQTIKNLEEIYSNKCRVFIRPSGTEPVMRVLVEAKNHKRVHSLSSEITNKLFSEINKIIN